MKIIIAILCVLTFFAATADSRVKTTRKVPKSQRVTSIIINDTTTTAPLAGVHKENEIILKGFNKRASDRFESFLVQNNTGYDISGFEMILRYTDLKGTVIHERTVRVNCNVPAGEQRQASVRSFDTHSAYYYYASEKPRKNATPFKVRAHIINYFRTIPIE